ncbi:MAG: hypothetical protein ACLFS0_06040 [Bacteroidales bacterium]
MGGFTKFHAASMGSGTRSPFNQPYNIAILAMALAMVWINFSHHNWTRDRVIEWDVKSYYAYLPAVFIYNDLSLEFLDEDPEKFGDLIWPVNTPTGKRAILTTMGMSVLYAPFFLLGHAYASITGWEADGYSIPYRFVLNFSTFFYLLAGLIFLKKVLLRYFSPDITAFTLVAIFMGTNLLYYATHEAAMTHGYSFALIALFLYLTIRYYDKPGSVRRIMLLGFLAGFITLIRPTNIIILFLFFLWGVDSTSALRGRVRYYLRNPHLVGIMALFFVLAWVPQFIYWKQVSGMFFFFTYGEEGGGFFWNNPQITNILVSYKKGWFVYTPLMFVAFAGIFLLPWRLKGLPDELRGAFLPILAFKLLNIYILSSWWAWWFGGGFGLRAFIDSYAIMALPLAAVFSLTARQPVKWRNAAFGLFVLLILFNNFQIHQYRRGAIHYWWMNKEAYWETFLRRKPTGRYWDLITIPDYEKAREGIYVAIDPEENAEKDSSDTGSKPLKTEEIEDHDTITPVSRDEYGPEEREQQILEIEQRLRNDPEMAEFIREKARKANVPADTMFRRDALWYYKRGEY